MTGGYTGWVMMCAALSGPPAKLGDCVEYTQARSYGTKSGCVAALGAELNAGKADALLKELHAKAGQVAVVTMLACKPGQPATSASVRVRPPSGTMGRGR